MNGVVAIDSVHGRTDLDYEQSWWDGQHLCFKGYDATGKVVIVRIAASILMTELAGFVPPHANFRGLGHPC